MGRMWSTLALSMLLMCVCFPKGEALPSSHHGTWMGTAGELRSVVLHDGKNGSTVGSAIFLPDRFCQYMLVYVDGAPGEVGVDLACKRYFCYYDKDFAPRRLRARVIGADKLLVEDFRKDGKNASHVLNRADDGTPAEGNCKLTPAEKLKASLEKKCKKAG